MLVFKILIGLLLPLCEAKVPSAPVKALLIDNNPVVLYTQADPTKSIGFYSKNASNITAVDGLGQTLWSLDDTTANFFGGFDFTGDGVQDLIRVAIADTEKMCGPHPWRKTGLELIDGVTASRSMLVDFAEDKCWDFGSTVYPTNQWSNLSVLFGTQDSLAVFPYYATSGSILRHQKTISNLVYPSVSKFATYPKAKYNAWGNGQKHLENSHVANGLITQVAGEERLVFFTSGRVVQYSLQPEGKQQLRVDHPFLTDGRKDLAGRNYGLVTLDPTNSAQIALIAGTSVESIYQDRISGTRNSDIWGQIERHLTLYNLETDQLQDKFYSYAHDANDGHQYQGRLVHPSYPWVTTGGSTSRLAFNLFRDGHWSIHLTRPGQVESELTWKDYILWNIQDINGDGTNEWIVSKTCAPDVKNKTDCYLPQWETLFAHWNETTSRLEFTDWKIPGIPRITAHFREPQRTTSQGFLYSPVSVVPSNKSNLLMKLEDGRQVVTEYP